MEISDGTGPASSKIASVVSQLPFHSIISPKSFPAAESRSSTSISPFSQSIHKDGGVVDYLSCVAYFEVKIESNLDGYFIFQSESYYNYPSIIICMRNTGSCRGWVHICRTGKLSVSQVRNASRQRCEFFWLYVC
jgi:hypothetical protein